MNKKEPKVIGIIEKMDFVDAEIEGIDAKVDTGADTCSVHCPKAIIKEIDGVEHLVFTLLDKKNPQYSGKKIITKEFKEKKIRSAIGDFEYRYQVKLKIRFYGKIYNTYFNLSNRSRMKYKVLIGRKFIKKKFLVDVNQNYLSTPK